MTHLLFNLIIFWFFVAPLQAQSITITSFTPSPVYVKVGNDLTLDVKYNYTGTGSRVGVIWKKEENVLIRRYPESVKIECFDKRALIKGDVSLVLRNVSSKDNGLFEVQIFASGIGDAPEENFNVVILAGPAKVFFSNRNTAFLSKIFSIICKAKGNPEPTYTLSHNDSTPFVINEGRHVITSVDHKDAGKWKCEATNKIGKASGNFNLTVSSVGSPTSTAPSPKTTTEKDIAKVEKSAGLTEAYVVVISFIGGTVFGMVLLYGIFLVRRWLLKSKNNPSNDQHSCHDYENEGPEKNPTYQELDISKMNEGENYQSLKMNTRSLKHDETPNKDEVGYAELNQVRGNEDENYQSLNKI